MSRRELNVAFGPCYGQYEMQRAVIVSERDQKQEHQQLREDSLWL